MADCEETLRELYAYLDHELTAPTHASVAAHLEGCLDCLQVFDFQAELRMVIAQKCREQHVPASLIARVQACFGIEATPAGGPTSPLSSGGSPFSTDGAGFIDQAAPAHGLPSPALPPHGLAGQGLPGQGLPGQGFPSF
jgi:mycothiol system anti-sigma-R factor